MIADKQTALEPNVSGYLWKSTYSGVYLLTFKIFTCFLRHDWGWILNLHIKLNFNIIENYGPRNDWECIDERIKERGYLRKSIGRQKGSRYS